MPSLAVATVARPETPQYMPEYYSQDVLDSMADHAQAIHWQHPADMMEHERPGFAQDLGADLLRLMVAFLPVNIPANIGRGLFILSVRRVCPDLLPGGKACDMAGIMGIGEDDLAVARSALAEYRPLLDRTRPPGGKVAPCSPANGAGPSWTPHPQEVPREASPSESLGFGEIGEAPGKRSPVARASVSVFTAAAKASNSADIPSPGLTCPASGEIGPNSGGSLAV